MPAPWTKKSLTWSRAALVLAVLVATLAHTLAARDVRAFSEHDELAYLSQAVALADGGVAAFQSDVRTFLATPQRWFYPAPTRYGQHLLGAAACTLLGRDFGALVAVSTLASIATALLAALLARRLAGNGAAAVAAVLLGSSPLWLHLGRRALADAHHAAVGLAAVWAFLEASRPNARPWTSVATVVLLAWHISTKETGVVLLAVLVGVHLVRAARRDVHVDRARPALLVLAGGLAAYGAFSALAGTLWAYPRVLSAAARAGAQNEYLALHYRGPLYRPLLDFLLLAPGVALLAPVALARGLLDRGETPRARLRRATVAATALLLPATLVVAFGTDMGWNVRYGLLLDALLRVGVAVWLARWAAGSRARAGAVGAGVLVYALVEAWLFRRVFLERGVYDPVTSTVIEALGLGGL